MILITDRGLPLLELISRTKDRQTVDYIAFRILDVTVLKLHDIPLRYVVRKLTIIFQVCCLAPRKY